MINIKTRNKKRYDRYKRVMNSVYNFKRNKTVLDYPPYILWIEPTNHCNLACVMCTNVDIPKDQRGYMEFTLFKKVIDEAKDFVFDINLFLGGESLLHKEVFKMIDYARSKGLKVCLNTNATLLTDKVSNGLIEAGLDVMTLSFDGYEKQTYESIRVKANFDKTLDNVIRFLEEKKRRGNKKPYTVFQVIEFNDPKTKSSREVKHNFYRKFKGLPLDKFFLIPAHNFGGRLTTKDDKKFRVRSRVYTPCTFLWYSMSILWDGRVVPCCIDFIGEYELGNVRNESLLDIWNSTKLVELRQRMIEKKYKEINLCKGCDALFKPKVFGIPLRSIKGAWSLIAGNR